MTKTISHARASVYSLLAFTLWTFGDSCTKLSGQTQLPVSQILVISGLFYLLTIIIVSSARGRIRSLKPKRWKLEIIRSLVLVFLSYVNVVSFTHFPLSTVYVALFTGPFLVALFAALFLRERLSLLQGLAILTGFGGVLLALFPVRPDFGNSSELVFAALILFPVMGAIHIVIVRVLGRTETSESMSFFPFLFRTLLLLPLFIFQFQPMTGEQIFYLAVLGFFAAIGSLIMMKAIKHAPAATVWTFQYSQLVSGAILGYLIWHKVPSANFVMGSAVIIVSGLILAHHVRRTDAKTMAAAKTAL